MLPTFDKSGCIVIFEGGGHLVATDQKAHTSRRHHKQCIGAYSGEKRACSDEQERKARAETARLATTHAPLWGEGGKGSSHPAPPQALAENAPTPLPATEKTCCGWMEMGCWSLG